MTGLKRTGRFYGTSRYTSHFWWNLFHKGLRLSAPLQTYLHLLAALRLHEQRTTKIAFQRQPLVTTSTERRAATHSAMLLRLNLALLVTVLSLIPIPLAEAAEKCNGHLQCKYFNGKHCCVRTNDTRVPSYMLTVAISLIRCCQMTMRMRNSVLSNAMVICLRNSARNVWNLRIGTCKSLLDSFSTYILRVTNADNGYSSCNCYFDWDHQRNLCKVK